MIGDHRRPVAAAGLVLVLVLLAGACTGDDGPGGNSAATGTPDTTVELRPDVEATDEARAIAYLERVSAEDFAAAWELLVPAQRETLTQEIFVTCSRQRLAAVDVQDLTVVGTEPTEIVVPGQIDPVAATTVVVEITAAVGGSETTERVPVRVLEVDGEPWVVLDGGRWAEMVAGRC